MENFRFIRNLSFIFVLSLILSGCPPAGPKTGKIGDTLSDGQFKITLTNFKLDVHNPNYLPSHPEDYADWKNDIHFEFDDIIVENISGDEIEFFSNDFYLMDDEGHIFQRERTSDGVVMVKDTSKKISSYFDPASSYFKVPEWELPIRTDITYKFVYQRNSGLGQTDQPKLTWEIKFHTGGLGETLENNKARVELKNLNLNGWTCSWRDLLTKGHRWVCQQTGTISSAVTNLTNAPVDFYMEGKVSPPCQLGDSADSSGVMCFFYASEETMQSKESKEFTLDGEFWQESETSDCWSYDPPPFHDVFYIFNSGEEPMIFVVPDTPGSPPCEAEAY